jgi:hypothetical protein
VIRRATEDDVEAVVGIIEPSFAITGNTLSHL